MARSIPIEQAITPYVLPERRGGYFEILCPNPLHGDKRLGSFKLYSNHFHCYACGIHGDSIKLVQMLGGYATPFEAAVNMCATEGYMSRVEAKEILSKKPEAKNIQFKKIEIPARKKQHLCQIKAPKELDAIYRTFIESCGPLTKEYLRVLREERHLSEDAITGFFPFPTRKKIPGFWRTFERKLLENNGISKENIPEALKGIPGFYQEKGVVRFYVPKSPCLGIITKDDNGLVTGIQLRKMGKCDKGFRYSFFSSGFADGCTNPDCEWGTNLSTPVDILKPTTGKRKIVALTEGCFKALTLQDMGCYVVNMHGIGNFEKSAKVANQLAEQIGAKRFLIVYDAEDNDNITKFAQSLCEMLRSKDIYFAVWDSCYGKGIDDVVNAGHKDKLKTVTKEEYFKSRKKVSKTLL